MTAAVNSAYCVRETQPTLYKKHPVRPYVIRMLDLETNSEADRTGPSQRNERRVRRSNGQSAHPRQAGILTHVLRPSNQVDAFDSAWERWRRTCIDKIPRLRRRDGTKTVCPSRRILR